MYSRALPSTLGITKNAKNQYHQYQCVPHDVCGRNFSIVALDAGADDDEAAADGGKCVAAWAGGWRRGRYAVQRPPRCLSRTDHFPFGARHSAETSAELNVRLGAAEFLPVASRQVRRVRKRRREGDATAAQWARNLPAM